MKGYKFHYNLEQAFDSRLKPIYHLKAIIVPLKSSLRVYAAKSKNLVKEKKLDENLFSKIVGVELLPKDNEVFFYNFYLL